MEWYIRKGIPLNLEHLATRSRDSGDWKSESITEEQFISLLQNKINSVSFSSIREDVVRFIPDEKVIELWSADYFNDLIEKTKFLHRLHINDQWSIPKPIEYGKNIRIRSTKRNITASVFNVTGSSFQKSLTLIERQLEFYVDEIAHIKTPMLQFKTDGGKAQIEFEQF